MKNIVQALLIIVLTLTLFSCENSDTSDSKNNNPQLQSAEKEENVKNTQIETNNNDNEDKKEANPKEEEIKEEVKTKVEETDANKSKLEIKKEDNKEEMYYYVGFYNINEDLLQRDKMKYGEMPKYTGPTPTYSDNNYVYTFIGWSRERKGSVVSIEPVKESAFYYAQYSKVEKDPEPVQEQGPAPCEHTDDLWYINDYHSEAKEAHGISADGQEVVIPYTEYILKYTKYQYSEYGYVKVSDDQSIEQTSPIGSYEVGQYYHNGEKCSNPSSHNIK